MVTKRRPIAGAFVLMAWVGLAAQQAPSTTETWTPPKVLPEPMTVMADGGNVGDG